MTSNLLKNKIQAVFESRTNYSHHCIRSLVIAALVMTTSPSYAFKFDEMMCSLNGNVRALYIQIEDPQSEVPCEVVENKRINSPDSATALWHAGDDAGYCKRKLEGYVEKLRGLGFECWHTGDTETIRESVTNNSTE